MTAKAKSRLLVKERRRQILDLLETEKRLTVEDLVKQFGVSAVTIRGDLDKLASSGEIVRSHGGAIKNRESFKDVPLNVKETLHHSEKVRIGHAAAMCEAIEDLARDVSTNEPRRATILLRAARAERARRRLPLRQRDADELAVLEQTVAAHVEGNADDRDFTDLVTEIVT